MGEAYLLYQNSGATGQNIIYDDENRKPDYYLVRFYDYDGTILKEEWVKPGEGVSPPAAPAHNNLVFQGWTHDENALAEILHDLDVGAIYCTSSGRTHIHIFLDEATGLEMTLVFTKADDSILYVEWGDNNTNSSSDVGFVRFTHTYNDYGNYIIDVHVGEGYGLYTFGGQDNNGLWYSVNGMPSFMTYSPIYYAIQEINIGGNIISLGTWSFRGCLGLKRISIPDNIWSIESAAFYFCNLKHVNIPYHIETLGNSSFARSGIESIVISPGITNVPIECFTSNKIKRIILPDGVTEIGNMAFAACYLLTDIYLPNGITTIGDSVFLFNDSLKNIYLPPSITNCGNEIFNGCVNLTRINLPENITAISENMFYGCFALENIEMPLIPEITVIADYAFQGCYSLKEIVLPDSLITLGNGVFYGCHNLKYVEIPIGVLNIGEAIFGMCWSLETIICRPSIPPILTGGLFVNPDVPNSFTKIYVQADSVDLYKADENWGRYADYIYPIIT